MLTWDGTEYTQDELCSHKGTTMTSDYDDGNNDEKVWGNSITAVMLNSHGHNFFNLVPFIKYESIMPERKP